MPLINISQQAERGFFTIEYRYHRRRRLILSDLSSPSFLSINAGDGTQHEREVLRMINLTEKAGKSYSVRRRKRSLEQQR